MSGFDGRFDHSYTQMSGTLRLGGNEVLVKFARPEESNASPLSGHWRASGSGQTCVLHVYDGSATIDVYSGQQSVFGESVGVTKLADGRFDVSLPSIGASAFIGFVDPERRSFRGTWYGRGFHCSENGPQGIFTRFNIE